jgi:hypothetical protein
MKSGLTPTEPRSLSNPTFPDRFRVHGERSAIKCHCSSRGGFKTPGRYLIVPNPVSVGSALH